MFVFFSYEVEFRVAISIEGKDQIKKIYTRHMVSPLYHDIDTDKFYFYPVRQDQAFFSESVHLSCNGTKNECNSFVSRINYAIHFNTSNSIIPFIGTLLWPPPFFCKSTTFLVVKYGQWFITLYGLKNKKILQCNKKYFNFYFSWIIMILHFIQTLINHKLRCIRNGTKLWKRQRKLFQ